MWSALPRQHDAIDLLTFTPPSHFQSTPVEQVLSLTRVLRCRVFWCDGQGEWRCVYDRYADPLPHLASKQSPPLSAIPLRTRDTIHPAAAPNTKFFGASLHLSRLSASASLDPPPRHPPPPPTHSFPFIFFVSGTSIIIFNHPRRCPHRLAPLSEGRVDSSGRIECGYHGWAFNGEGSCESIPQVPSDRLRAATGSLRACVTAYPTVIRQGVRRIAFPARTFRPSSSLVRQDAL